MPAADQVGQVGEVAAVLDFDPPGGEVRGEVRGADAHRPVGLRDFPRVGVRLAVGGHQSVHQEVAVGGETRRAEVAAVGPVAASGLVARGERLVHEVPEESALQRRMPIHDPPVVGDAADAVAHGVGVFDEHERPHRALGGPALRVVLEPVGTHIHRGDDVHILAFAGTLVEDRPGGIGAADPLRGAVEGLAVPGFVAERPDDDRRMVAVALHHADRAVEVRLEPVGPPGERDAGLVSHAVGLDVRFVHDIEPVFVGEFVEPGQVRVVRGADGVDVQRLHQAQVFPHRRFVHDMAALRVVFVAVHAPNGERPPVEQQPGVPDFDPPEPDADRCGFGRAPGGIAQRQREPVERRGLGGPGAHRPEVPLQRCLGLSAGFDRGFEGPRRSRNRAAFGIEDFHQQVARPRRSGRQVFEERGERKAAVPV